MLIKNRKLWLVIWLAILGIIILGGFKDGWTPLRIIAGLLLLASGILNWLGWYVNVGVLQRLDRMSEEQRAAFLGRLKEHERVNLVKRLEFYRQSQTRQS